MMRPGVRLLACFACLGVLAGCGNGEHEDIRQWMDESSRGLKGSVPPLPELRPFPVVSYEAFDQSDPFSTGRVAAANKEGSDINQPDFDRPPEPLEAFPLDSIQFIGRIGTAEGRQHALVRIGGVVYRVTKGNYMGQNYGRIVDINDSEIILSETVKDPSGQTAEWVERQMTLQLIEGQQGKGGGK